MVRGERLDVPDYLVAQRGGRGGIMKIPNGHNNSALLECPNCGFDYLHQGVVEIFDRTEDAESGRHLLIDGSSTLIDSNVAGNPSPRRHGMTVEFECENCTGPKVLAIIQHKGQTFIYWL
jgi:hypothetical protein